MSGTTIKTPMDENKDWVGQRMCWFSTRGRVTVHGALWALDVRTGKNLGQGTISRSRMNPAMLSTGR